VKRTLSILATVALTAVPCAAATAAGGAAPTTAVERGGYLVAFGSCHDCHTPWQMTPEGPSPDMTRMLSGHPQDLAMPPAPVLPAGPWTAIAAGSMTAWSGPWGVSFTANLTPDPDTGLGKWTEQEFIATMRSGRHQGRGRQLLPPMPWQSLNGLTDEDLKAIFAYLKSIPAIRNRVPDPIAPAPAH